MKLSILMFDAALACCVFAGALHAATHPAVEDLIAQGYFLEETATENGFQFVELERGAEEITLVIDIETGEIIRREVEIEGFEWDFFKGEAS